MEAIKERTFVNAWKDKADILTDTLPFWKMKISFEEINDLLEEGEITAEFALKHRLKNIVKCCQLEDAYLRERAADLQDIGKRWLYNVAEVAIVDLSSPSCRYCYRGKRFNSLRYRPGRLGNVLAFVTEIGGKTAHSSIMARSLELPAVVGTGNICSGKQWRNDHRRCLGRRDYFKSDKKNWRAIRKNNGNFYKKKKCWSNCSTKLPSPKTELK